MRQPGGLFIVSILILVVLALILAAVVVNESKKPRPATVYFNSGVVDGDKRKGQVAKRDKYVVVKTDAGTEVFTWDKIRYISEEDAEGSTQVERVVDVIDLLSKLGIAATVLFFTVGLMQYRQGQKWEREKFLAAAVKEFSEWHRNRKAMAMIDSLALYPNGRTIELFPNAEKPEDKSVLVRNDDIYTALATESATKLDEPNERDKAIRDCFDSFLSYMSTFRHYVEQELITLDALGAHIGYWFALFRSEGDRPSKNKAKLPYKYRKRIFEYAEEYDMGDFQTLVQKYNQPSVWQRIRKRFRK